MKPVRYPAKAFWQALGLNFVWMNASELFRWYVVVKPMVRSDFASVPGITPDTPLIGLLWIVWDLLLIAVTTIICWLVLERQGPRSSTAVLAGTLIWLSVFVLLWLGVHNMGLATPRILAAALPLAWLELVIAAGIVSWRMSASGSQGVSVQV